MLSILNSILDFLFWYTLVACCAGLIIARIMRFGLHYKPPEMPPLPSGSLRDGPNSILGKRRTRAF